MTSIGRKTSCDCSPNPISEAALNSTVIRITGRMNITPPMVGVPILVMWRSGPSTRINLPILKARSTRFNGPPQMTAIMKLNMLMVRVSEVSCIMMRPPMLR